jgi:rhamnose utilization protein RhaD (predicted bifunctional aldolase and dehydrogenase)
MSTIAIKESYVDTLRLFGEVDELLDEAVEQYLIDRVVERIKRAKGEAQAFEKLYGMDYAAFAERVQLDADYYNQVNPLWEQDMLAWEYWDAEAREWTEKLGDMRCSSGHISAMCSSL